MSVADSVIQIIDTKLEKALPIFLEKMETAVNESVQHAADKFYSDYEPQTPSEGYPSSFGRANDLANIVEVGIINGGLKGSAIKLDMSNFEKPSWHYARLSSDGSLVQIEGYPEGLYEAVFKQGYHGGRGGSHSLWGKGVAQKTEAPFDIMIKEIREYENRQAQADFEAAYHSV